MTTWQYPNLNPSWNVPKGSVIKKSSMNGNIVVNDVDIPVYDDSQVKQDLAGVETGLSQKANQTNLDITNKNVAANTTSLADMATLPASKDLIGLQNAISKANGILQLPPGDFVLDGSGTELLLINKPLKIKGSGFTTKLIIKSTVPSTTDVIRVSPSTVSNIGKSLYSIEDLQIVAESGTPARHGINLDVTNAGQYLSKFTMKNVIVNPLGGKAFKLTNPTNVDGLFASSIHNNLLYGGMEFERIGDSVVIKENTITGNNTGIQMSSIDGACQVVIEKNNITSDGGAINISKADQVKIRHNQIEQVNAYTGDSININACVYLGNTPNAEVIGNNITAHGKVAHNIRSNGYRVKIDKNTMRKGTAEMVRIDSSANKNDIGYNNFYIDTNENEIAPSILDNGIGTMGVEKTLTLLNGYSVSDSVNFGQATAEKDSAGNVRLKGTLSVGTRTAGTVICNLPVGFRPTKARYCNVGYYNFTSSKMEVLTFLIEPTGNVSVVYALDTGRIDLDGISFKASY